MTHVAAMPGRRPRERESIQAYARLAGVLGPITVVAGGFGEAYAPGLFFVTGDPAATAQHILGHESLFRWGFASYLVEALCDATLTMAFWVLVHPVHPRLAMLMVVFRIISTCGFGASEVLYYRSGYLPRVFGVAMMVAGAAFVAHAFLLILAPAYASDLLLATAAVAFVPFILWLLVKGVNAER